MGLKKELKRYLFSNMGKAVIRYKEGGSFYYFYVNEFDGNKISGVIIDKKSLNQMSIDNLVEKDSLSVADFRKLDK